MALAPEGIPEGIKIVHSSGTRGTEDVIANNIRLRRIRLGWTQAKLAAEAGHPIKTRRIFLIENRNRDPRRDEIRLIAEALGCDPKELEKRN